MKLIAGAGHWHRADYESDAMWKLYAGQSKGVALCTPERIRAAVRLFRFKPEYGTEDLFGGIVKYVDLLKVRMNTSMLNRFFFKHKAFSWEQEFRLAISVRVAEECGVHVPELDVPLSVDLDVLIERVVLGPLLKNTEIAPIMEIVTEAGSTKRIVKSSLLGQPRYV